MQTSSRIKPSFVTDVRSMLDNKQFESALQLSADGVRAFPTYLGGYVLLAESFSALGFESDAEAIAAEIARRFGRTARLKTPELEKLKTPEETEKKQKAEKSRESPLRIIELAPQANDTRVIKSSSVRLIPGLEYTTLRFEGGKHRGQRILQPLSDPPQFREFHAPRKSGKQTDQPVVQKKLSLEELAERIGRVRITPADLEGKPPAPNPIQTPRASVVSETLARIYMEQRNYDKAIDALRILQSQHPTEHQRLQDLINKCIELKDSTN